MKFLLDNGASICLSTSVSIAIQGLWNFTMVTGRTNQNHATFVYLLYTCKFVWKAFSYPAILWESTLNYLYNCSQLIVQYKTVKKGIVKTGLTSYRLCFPRLVSGCITVKFVLTVDHDSLGHWSLCISGQVMCPHILSTQYKYCVGSVVYSFPI